MNRYSLTALILITIAMQVAHAQNPLISGQFSADPSARVFGGRVYVYPSHDIPCVDGKGRPGWFCMEDYHVFSSADLVNWTDHGKIVDQEHVAWADPKGYSMWAPDCINRNGKYYFYFPTKPKDTGYGKGFAIGVAIADKPSGPFIPQATPIVNVHGIDPNVFIDKDGQAYLYWSQGNIYAAKLKENMLELASDPQIIQNLPEKGLKEGPYLFERNGIYYLTYPHVENKIERLEYATGPSPLGPFKVTGVIMDESPTGCWTNHHSILPFNGQWYLFYHHNDYSPQFDKNRSIRLDSLAFEANGNIRKVIPTLRGVGLTDANKPIQLDRYSAIDHAAIAFVDTTDKFKGWKTIFAADGAGLQYNSVQFRNSNTKTVQVRAFTQSAGQLQLRIDKADGPVVSEFNLKPNTGWNNYDFAVSKIPAGIHHLFVTQKGGGNMEIDWIRFL